MNEPAGRIGPSHLLGLWCLLFFAHPVGSPAGAEFVYLLGPFRRAFPEFLAGDWTLAGGSEKAVVFDLLFSYPMRLFPLAVVGVIGRGVGLLVLVWLLLRLGRWLGIGPLATTVAVAGWLVAGQSLVGGEEVVTTLQPKLLAYAAWLAAVDRVLAGRARWAGLGLGLAFSIHPSVGLAAGFATGVGILALGWRGRRVTECLGFAALGALPGLLPLVSTVGGNGMSRAEWKWQALVRSPTHLEVFGFSLVGMVVAASLLAFTLAVVRRRPSEPSLRFILVVQGALGVLFLAGVLARTLGRYELLSIYPFRVFPWFVLLTSLLLVARLFADRRIRPPGWPEIALALPLLLLAPKVGRLVSARIAEVRTAWGPDDDLARTFQWIADSTPEGTPVILPPWRRDSYLLARRPQVISHEFLRLDSLATWRERLEDLIGPTTNPWSPAARRHYLQLSMDQIERIRRRYRGDYLVSSGEYPIRPVFRAGEWAVYRVADGDVAAGQSR